MTPILLLKKGVQIVNFATGGEENHTVREQITLKNLENLAKLCLTLTLMPDHLKTN